MNKLADNTKLYRIIDFFTFVEIVTNKKENYLKPRNFWEDPYEGMHLLKADEKSLKLLCDRLKCIFPNANDQTIVDHACYLIGFLRSCYAQSWSLCKDSDAMWRIYDKNHQSVQIISNKQKFTS